MVEAEQRIKRFETPLSASTTIDPIEVNSATGSRDGVADARC
jgi:hypothetical protein